MNETTQRVPSKPFLKWAGGKTQMLGDLRKYIPHNFNKYIEPFIGAGALYFDVAPEEGIIADSNGELILTYNIIKYRPQELIEELGNFENSEEFYYKVRSWELQNYSDIQRAARFIYLNKTCFNGLYRVNKKGGFNVPFGKRKNPTICDEERILAASETLKESLILNSDFENVLNEYAERNDFVFLDPPYVPVGKFSDFKRYTKDFFHEEDHIRLKKQFDRLVEIGAKPLLTNSDAPFVLDLFKEYDIKIISTRRSISSNAKTRKGKDLIVIGF